MPSLRAYAAVLVTALAACSAEDVFRHFVPADADSRARAYIELIAAGHVDSARGRLLPQLTDSITERQFAGIGRILDGQRFDSTQVIGAQTNVTNGVRHVNMTYELHSARGWSITNVATVDSAGTWFVEGINVQALARPLEEANRFGLEGKTARHYVWLLLTVLATAISLATACWIATRRAMPKRWRWVFASLLGVGAFSLNWASGEIGVRLVSVQLASAAFVRAAPVAPWIITFGVPAGALLALHHYRRWRTSALPPAAGDTSATQPTI
ncbi:MAG: hypothetical protein ACJ8AD_19595 [Gemmatimonadaceae bacterium]